MQRVVNSKQYRTPRALAGCLALAVPLIMAGCGSTSASPAPTPTATVHVPSTVVHSSTPVIQPSATAIPTFVVPAGTPIPANQLAMKVNGRPVYLREYMQLRAASMRQIYASQHVNPTSAKGHALLVKQMTFVQNYLTFREILLPFVKRYHQEITAAQLQQAELQAGGHAAFLALLHARNTTLAAYKQQVGMQNVESYIVTHPQYRADEAHVSLILVRTKAQAAKLRSLLAKGGDFVALAKQYSLDQSTGARGGDAGFVTAKVLPAPLNSVAFTLPLNTISQVLPSPQGFYIVRVSARIKNAILVGENLRIAQLAYWNDWVLKQRKAAHVQIFVKPG